jgi:hypothetical protein
MNDELAHWRYRLRALDRDIPATKELQQTCKGVAKVGSVFGLDSDVWAAGADLLGESLDTMRYLREEARYMIEVCELRRETQ